MARKILEVSEMRASVLDTGKEILKGVDFEVLENETVALLGPNGAGKSTVAGAIMGNPKFKVSGQIDYFKEKRSSKNENVGKTKPDGVVPAEAIAAGADENIDKTGPKDVVKNRDGKWEKYNLMRLSPDKRARLGIFMSFQNPLDIPGITTTEMLREALVKKLGRRVTLDETREKLYETVKKLGRDVWFLERELNVGFSGGEKKVNEILQMIALEPRLVILDEIDSGLDIDTAEEISEILAEYKKKNKCSYLIITHNMRVLKKLKVDKTILMRDGRVYKTGDGKLAGMVERNGFKAIFEEIAEENGGVSSSKTAKNGDLEEVA